MRSCVCSDSPRLLHFPLFAVHHLFYHPVFLPAHQLHLSRCGGQIPCALQLMRTLAPLPSTTLSHKFSWCNSRSTKFRNCSLKNCLRRLHSCFGRRTSNLKRVRVQVTQRKQCHGLKKSRWQIQSTILRRHDRFFGCQYPNFETLDARIATALARTIQTSNSCKKVHFE